MARPSSSWQTHPEKKKSKNNSRTLGRICPELTPSSPRLCLPSLPSRRVIIPETQKVFECMIFPLTMGQPTLIAWLLVCYLLIFAWETVASENKDNEDVRLRVVIREDRFNSVPSCQHVFSQVELLNLDPNESITIHSIQAAPEETELTSSTSGGEVGKKWDDEELPQQLHVSKLPVTGSLEMGPGQAAIVPVTFLARFPNVEAEVKGGTFQDPWRPHAMSPTVKVDLVDLVGESALEHINFKKQSNFFESVSSPETRNNLDPSSLPQGDEFEVKTTIVVDTSRGVLKFPVTVSSVQRNAFAIPDVIRFHHPDIPSETLTNSAPDPETKPSSISPPFYSGGVVLMDTIHVSDNDISIKRSLTPPQPERDCFDLYLSNPSPDNDLQIIEVLVSKPELMSVEFNPNRLLLQPELVVIETGPTHVIKEWTEDGPMFLPADSDDNYVVTVCTAAGGGVQRDDSVEDYLRQAKNWIDTGSPAKSLGFLQIKTASEILFISLERFDDPVVTAAAATGQSRASNNTTKSSSSTVLLKSSPDRLKFHLTSSANPESQLEVRVHNKSPVPIRIMRLAVGMDTSTNDDLIEKARRIGMQLSVSFGNGTSDASEPGEGHGSIILSPADFVDNALVVKCRIKSLSSLDSLNLESFYFTGTIVMRGTMDTELSYEEWREEMIRNPYREEHLVLEIPYTVTVLNGRVELMIERSTHPYPQIFRSQPWDKSGRAVGALYFPQHRFESLEGSEDPLPTQRYQGSDEISHDLRIMSSMTIPLQLVSAEIIDAADATGADDSLCSRFNVSIERTFDISANLSDLDELGFLSLQYKFGDSGRQKSDDKKRLLDQQNNTDSIYPTTCYLHVVTNPADAGMQRISLVVFPGQLQVSSPYSFAEIDSGQKNAQHTDEKEVSRATSSATVGFGNLLSWLRSSVVGTAMLEALEGMDDDKRSRKRDSQLLSNYLRGLCNGIPIMKNSRLSPILLKIGAVEHSETAYYPLHLTNHNPLPITVSIETGAVEGFSIGLGRDVGQGHGDGNNMLDYLPKQSARARKSDVSTLVHDGKYNGHPLNGLRQFLLSNERALSLFGRFPFRDSVSLDRDAISKENTLQPLYRRYSTMEFHTKHNPCNVTSGGPDGCLSSLNPPLYSGPKQTEKPSKHQVPGPLLISSDKKLIRRLKVFPGRGIPDDSSKKFSVSIPPGGTARFEVRLRAPPHSYMENDISQLVSTGLVLSTNLGHIMPLFATFEALQGQVHVSRVGSSTVSDNSGDVVSNGGGDKITLVDVPLGLVWQQSVVEDDVPTSWLGDESEGSPSPTISVPTGSGTDHVPEESQHGVDLHLSSSFSREVRLKKVDSCNPWFKVTLRRPNFSFTDKKEGGGAGASAGVLRNMVSCSKNGVPEAEDVFPSFYQCVLNWLNNREDLQPTGCGVPPVIQKRKTDDETVLDVSSGGMGRALRAFEAALDFLNSKYMGQDSGNFLVDTRTYIEGIPRFSYPGLSAIKTGTKRTNGYVPSKTLDIFAEAWDAWRVAAEYGLHSLSSSLKATIEYDTRIGEETGAEEVGRQSLSLSMQNLAVQSVLVAPKLVDGDSVDSDNAASVMSFPPTTIGTVVSMTLPLRNPTAVPVRVRLGAAAPSIHPDEHSGQLTADENLREVFFENLSRPYVQNGQSASVQDESAHHLWWDGGGAFFTSDERGDVIRSNHNITIRAGAGAHVSLVNPSLHASVAFLVGCGLRCGVRDDSHNGKSGESSFDPKLTSPIGAAGAVGITLSGRKRWPTPEENARSTDEPNIRAGGAPIPGSGGPPAFAIPYSALDEIVIPPYGVGEVGPIFFRPPGRRGVLGCDLARESGANHWGVSTGEMCDAKYFQSMVLLENSLTGIERVVLRGQSLWGRLYFLDPPPKTDEEDDFGDIEFRNGRPTLMFTGSSVVATEPPKDAGWGFTADRPSAVVKEVLLHNGGDVSATVVSIFLTDTSTTLARRQVRHRPCSFDSFRLLNCEESDLKGQDRGSSRDKNVEFLLSPGESKSLLVEHVPDCSKQEEFVSLVVEFTSDSGSGDIFFSPGRDDSPMSRSRETRSPRLDRNRNSFGREKLDLVVGYQMNDEEFLECSPVENPMGGISLGGNSASARGGYPKDENQTRYDQSPGRKSTSSTLLQDVTVCLLEVSLFVGASVVLVYALLNRSQAMTATWPRLRLPVALMGMRKPSPKIRAHVGVWNAAFRCLSRADPTSTELQNLGREQIRQVIIGRYRARGAHPPQSWTSSNSFSRDRLSSSSAGASRQRAGKEGVVAPNEKFRTLSDALFQDFSSEHYSTTDRGLPVGLSWRTAYSRGIIDESSIGQSTLRLQTRDVAANGSCDNSKPSNEVDGQTAIHSDKTATDSAGSVAEPSAAKPRKDSGPSPVETEARHVTVDKSPPGLLNIEEEASNNSSEVNHQVQDTPRKHGASRENENSTTKEQGHQCTTQKGRTGPKQGSGGAQRNGQRSAGRYNRTKESTAAAAAPPLTAPTASKKTDKSDTSQKRVADAGTQKSASSFVPKVTTTTTTTTTPREKNIGHGNKNVTARTTGESGKGGHDNGVHTTRKQKPHKQDRGKANKTPSGNKVAPVANSQKKASKGSKATSGIGRAQATVVDKNRSSPKHSQVKVVPSLADARDSPMLSAPALPFRPPPGLAPPPGFGHGPAIDNSTVGTNVNLDIGTVGNVSTGAQTDLGPMLTAALSNTTELNLRGSSPSSTLPFSQVSSGRSDLLFIGNIGDNPRPETTSTGGGSVPAAAVTAVAVGDAELPFPVHPSPTMSTLASPTDGLSTSHAGFVPEPVSSFLDDRQASNGFDVMDFLDSILDDGGGGGASDRNNHHHTVINTTTTTTTTAVVEPSGNPFLDNAETTLSLNPWASEGKSRAAAYGISFDDTDDMSSESSPIISVRAATPTDDNSFVHGTIPLLTPAAILWSGQEEVEEDGDTQAFYASLIED